MKLSDLKTGMWVRTRNGNMYLFLKDYKTQCYGIGTFVSNTGFMSLRDYDDNMKCEKNHSYDIVEVFRPDGDAFILDKNCAISIWKEKTIELTPFEVELFKYMNPKFKWIVRDANEVIWVYENKPKKGKYIWFDDTQVTEFLCFGDMFKTQPFTWLKLEDEEPYYIPDLIKEG